MSKQTSLEDISNKSLRANFSSKQNGQQGMTMSDTERLELLKHHNQTLISQLNLMYAPKGVRPDSGHSSILENDSQSVSSSGSASNSRSKSVSNTQSHPANSRQSLTNSRYHTPSLGHTSNQAEPVEGLNVGNHDNRPLQGTGDVGASSSARTLSKTSGADKVVVHETYFEFSDFDMYVESMAKRITKEDVKNKVEELKDLANTLRLIAQADLETDLDSIINKHLDASTSHLISQQKQVVKMSRDNKKSTGDIRELLKTQAANQMVKNSTKTSRKASLSGGINSMAITSVKRQSNFYTEDSNSKVSDEQQESFENFLLENGVGVPNQSKVATKETIVSSRANIPALNKQQNSNPSFSFIKPEENTSVNQSSQTEPVATNLQQILMRNLQEITEVKYILRSGMGPGESKENVRSNSPERRSSDHLGTFTQSSEGEALEQKLQEAQIERLLKKVKALNEKIQKLEKESLEKQKASEKLRKCLHVGKVNFSKLILAEVDLLELSLDHIYAQFPMLPRTLQIYSTHICIYADNSSSDEQEELRLTLGDLELIYYLEKPGSFLFLFKLLDKDRKMSWGLQSSHFKVRSLENLSNFYFVEVEDSMEMSLWESVFFLTNFKIIAQNLETSWNRSDFLSALQVFVQRYIQANGDANRALSDIGNLINSNRTQPLQSHHPQLSRMGSMTASEPAVNEKLGLAEMLSQKRQSVTANVPTLQIPLFVKNRLDEEKFDSKEEVNNLLAMKRAQYQKQRSLSIKEPGVEEELSSVEEVNHMTEENEEDYLDWKDEKTRQQHLTSLGKKLNNDLDDEVFSKHLKVLLDGKIFSKYGKWGRKHDRHVRISSDLKSIEWLNPLKPKKKRRHFEIKGVTEIAIGRKSLYFVKKKIPFSEIDLCFSIITKGQSLHLQAGDLETREEFVGALRYILKEKMKLKKLTELPDSSPVKLRLSIK